MIFDMSFMMKGGKKYLYRNGDQCGGVTGGWSATGWIGTSEDTGAATKAPDITFGSSAMTVSMECQFYGDSGAAHMAANVNITPYKTLHVVWNYTMNNCLGAVTVVDRSAAYWFSNAAASLQCPNHTSSGGYIESVLDVSAVTGSFDVVIGLHGWGDTTNTIDVSAIWLE